MSTEIERAVERISAHNTRLITGFDERLTEYETELARLKSPGYEFTGGKDKSTPETKAFGTFLRRGEGALGPDERKVLTISDDPSAGYLAPRQVAAEIIKGVTAYSPLRQIARVVTSNRESIEIPKKTASGTAAWVSETGTRSETTGLAYGMERLSPYEMYYLAKVSVKMLEDSAYNLEGELAEEFAQQFASLEGTAFINGTGSGQPEGVMTNASITHIASGDASLITADGIMSLPYSLKSEYARNGHYVMSRATLGTVRKLKDTTSGDYLWQPGFGSQPSLLCGYPVLECSDMPAIGGGNFPVIFGDFRRGYIIVDRVQIAVQRLTEYYATSGQVGFLARKRVTGQVVLPEAFIKLEIAAS